MKKKTKIISIITSLLTGSTIIVGATCATLPNNVSSRQQNVANYASGEDNKDFGTGQATLNGSIDAPSLALGYPSAKAWTIGNNVPNIPAYTDIVYTLSQVNPNDASYLSINDSILNVATGLPLGEHDFTIACSLSHIGYNPCTFYSTFEVAVTTNNLFPNTLNLTYNSQSNLASQVYSANSTDTYSYTVDITNSLPDDTTITFAKTNATAPYYDFNNNDLIVTNIDQYGDPLKVGPYALPYTITLATPGYVTKTYDINPTFNVTPVSPPTPGVNLYNMDDTIAAPYLVNAGTTLYYNGTTSAAAYANKFVDLYKFAMYNGADLDQKITFNITGNLTVGLLIDPRFVDIEITANAAYTIAPTVDTNLNNEADGILVASTVNTTPATYSNTLKIDTPNLSINMDYSGLDFWGAVVGYKQGFIGTDANIDIGVNITVIAPHQTARGIQFNNTITGANINIDTRTLIVNTTGYTVASTVCNAYGVLFNAAINASPIQSIINISRSSTADCSVTASGASYGFVFNAAVNSANINFADNVKMLVTTTYSGTSYCISFNTLGASNTSVSVTISGWYSADNSTSVLNSGVASGIIMGAITSLDASTFVTLNVTKLATFFVKSNNSIAYGIFINTAIPKFSNITLDANIQIKEQSAVTYNIYGIRINGAVSCNIDIGALIYIYNLNSYDPRANTTWGVQMGAVGENCTVSYTGIMSIVFLNSLIANTFVSTVYGINVVSLIPVTSKLLVTGMINIINGSSITNTSNNLSYGVWVGTANNEGTLEVSGTAAAPACINLASNPGTTSATGQSMGIYFYGSTANAAIITNYLSVCLDGNYTNQNFIGVQGTGTSPAAAPFKGSTTGINASTTKVYSSKNCSTWNANFFSSTFTINWNGVTQVIGNSNAPANNTQPDANVASLNYLHSTATTNNNTAPAYVDDFAIGMFPATSGGIKDFNKALCLKFKNWYVNRPIVLGSQPAYEWLNKINDANQTAAGGWNASA